MTFNNMFYYIMDETLYSDTVIKEFILTTLCQNDKKLYAHYMNDDVDRFRERLSRKFTDKEQKNIEQVISASVCDTIQDIILDTIGKLSEYMYYNFFIHLNSFRSLIIIKMINIILRRFLSFKTKLLW